MAFELGELKLAFQLHVTDLVVLDDDVTTNAEAAFMARVLPQQRLAAHGFVDAEGKRTERFQEAAVEALERLPDALTDGAKFRLLQRCYAAADADETVRLGEGAVLLMAARLLGLPDVEIDAWLEERNAAGLSVAGLDEVD